MFYYDYEYGFRHYKFFSCIYESLILCQFDHTRPLFMQNSILKFQDRICLENILFVSKSLNNLSPSFLIHGLVFPQINIIMKPQVLRRVTS